MMKKFGFCRLRRAACDVVSPTSPGTSFNLREEYANAFRTESYNDFWARVIDLNFADGGSAHVSKETAAARLPSYRLLAENLLDPDQSTASKILAAASTQCRPENLILLAEYYSETANASILCGLLLKDIDNIRLKYRPLRATLKSLAAADCSEAMNSLRYLDKRLSDFSKSWNPFNSPAISRGQFDAVRDGSVSLLKRLELGRRKAKAELRLLNRLKHAAALLLVVITASASVVGVYIALHVLVALMALPGFVPAASRVASTRWLARVLAQLDAATKGAYILSRDLDTISRLVDRLGDEAEHMLGMLRFCLVMRGGDRRRLKQEVVRQLWKNDASFNQQLDELEEHLYLCFMTINKARSLVMNEVLVPGKSKGKRLSFRV